MKMNIEELETAEYQSSILSIVEDENCCPSYDIDWLSGIWGVCWACRC